jgi:hypothetical protein
MIPTYNWDIVGLIVGYTFQILMIPTDLYGGEL